MTNRKKRLKKGIESLKEQIDIHEEKRRHAEEKGDEDLVDYYNREIAAKIKTKEEKEAILDKQ